MKIKVRINDTSKNYKRNEDIAMKRMMSSRKDAEVTLPYLVTLEGPGAQELIRLAGGKEALAEMLETAEVDRNLEKRYGAKTLSDLFYEMPTYSTLYITVDTESEYMREQLLIIMVKEAAASYKEPHTFRVPKIKVEVTETLK